MAEFLEPEEVTKLSFSNNPYMRALQAANRIGLMGVLIEDVERTFPLGITDVLCVAHDVEEGSITTQQQIDFATE
jgi:hypothetical protein